jgi:carbon-monoxide dehydrogenase large subunit
MTDESTEAAATGPDREVTLEVNGRAHRITVTPRTLLSDALREQCALTGTHVGCEHGVCGACTVLLDGQPIRSCLMLAVQADGRQIATVEGLGTPDRLNPLQQAFHAEHGLQCGFCTPGILMTLTAALDENPGLSEAELRHTLSGNLCRCTGYQNIVAAALRSLGRPPKSTVDEDRAGHETGTPTARAPIGEPVARREDRRLLTGTARYVDDIVLPGAVHVHFVRSPHAHARILRVHTEEARAADGVLGVFTGADLAAWTVPLRLAPPIEGLVALTTETLPTSKVRFAGDPVAAVVATSRYVAEDAAERVRVDYQPLAPTLDSRASLDGSAPLVDESLTSNVVFHEHRTSGDVTGAFERAHRVVRTRFAHQRMTHAPLETRGCAAVWDAGRAELTMHTGTQVPHPYRTQLAARLGLTEAQVRVIVPDVGGAFGQKLVVHREDLVVAALARHLGRPCCWREDRAENLTAALAAREDGAEVEAAVTADGRILALRARLLSDFGAYAVFPANYMLRVVAMLLPNVYRLTAYEYEMDVVLSNRIPASPMRAPMAVCTWITEGTVDAIARELGLDPVEVRERNMLRERELPYRTATGELYEDITPYRTFTAALSAFGYPEFRERQRADRAAGVHRGLGIACLVEPTTYGSAFYRSAGIAGSGHESAWARIDPSGAVVASVGIAAAGQGHETTFGQAVASGLGVRAEDVTIRLGDTEVAPYGMGARGARSGTAGGGAALLAGRRLKEKVLDIARGRLVADGVRDAEASELDVRDGEIVIAKDAGWVGTGLSIADIARMAYLDPLSLPQGIEPGLFAQVAYDPPPMIYSNAVHLCEVVVDQITGRVTIERYLVAEDAGTLINPSVVAGQLHGAVALGLGGVLFEGIGYDADGHNLTASFRDYVLPTARETPHIELLHCGTPNSRTPGGMKGMSEGGVMGAIAAVTAAINDSIAPFGVIVSDLPITASRLSDLLADRTPGTAPA